MKTPHDPDSSELVGAKEACAILGVDKMTLWRWRQPGSGKPHSSYGDDRTYMIPPKQRVGNRPVWARADVEEFARTIGRQRAPRRRNTSEADGRKEALTTIVLQNDREVSVLERPEEVLAAIADARKHDHPTGKAKITIAPSLAGDPHDAWVDPAAVRFVQSRSGGL